MTEQEARKGWSDDKNRKRAWLIDKEIDGVISEGETAELERLQEEMLVHRHKVAPLPLDDLRKIHQELLQQVSAHREAVRKAVENERKACAAILDAEAQRIEELDDDGKQEIYDDGPDAYDDPFEVEASAYRTGAAMIRGRIRDEDNHTETQ